MRHTLIIEGVGSCQECGEPILSQDVLTTGQGRLCQECCLTTRSSFVWTRAEFGETARWRFGD